ncbi:MAG: hypothetical protein ABW352_19440 [Polyangiales bacterium]
MIRKLNAVFATAGFALLSSHAQAQSDAPVTNTVPTPTVPEQTSTTEIVPQPPLPAVAPNAAGPVREDKREPSTTSLEEVSAMAKAAQALAEYVRIYGILRPIASFSGRAVESFSNPNQSAATAAANPALAALPNDARLSFQVAQSRFGMWFGEKTPLRGHIEFDFIDFARSSPTVQSLIRLRIATIEYDPIDKLTLIAGQDWDLFSPINAHGMNLVGTHFQSGNTGFMRNQLKVLYKLGDKLELGGAIGLQGANAAFRDAALELGRMPTFAVRATALLGKLGKVGINGIATRLRLSPGPTERMTFAGAGGLFGEITPTETTQIRFEGYAGQNLANLGTLALAQATLADDIKEIGGFVSVRQTFLNRHAFYGSFGTAQTFNGEDVAPSYAYAASAAGATPALGSATLAGTGPGIRWNEKALIGYDFKPVKALSIGLEVFWFKTRHQLQEVDVARISNATRKAFGADVGMVYSF